METAQLDWWQAVAISKIFGLRLDQGGEEPVVQHLDPIKVRGIRWRETQPTRWYP
jgi:hypothetical protein